MKINKIMSVAGLVLATSVVTQAQTTPLFNGTPTGNGTSSSPYSLMPTNTASPQSIFISGSTAFRAQIYQGLVDMGLTKQSGDSSGNNQFTFQGTITGAGISNEGDAPNGPGAGAYNWKTLVSNDGTGVGEVTIYCSFDGSAQGVHEAATPSVGNTYEALGGNTFTINSTAGSFCFFHDGPVDLAFSDVAQFVTPFAADEGNFDLSTHEISTKDAQVSTPSIGVAVQPFLWACNSNAAAVFGSNTNIDDEQLNNLLTLGSAPASLWNNNGGDTNQILLTGRDNTSGTRITTELLVNYTLSTPLYQYTIGGGNGKPGSSAANSGQFAPAPADTLGNVGNQAYGSGGNVAFALAFITNGISLLPAVGYVSFSDAYGSFIKGQGLSGGAVPNGATYLTLQGKNPIVAGSVASPLTFAYNMSAVTNGVWPYWATEHLYYSSGDTATSVPAKNVGPALAEAVEWEIFQSKGTTGTNGVQTAVLIGDMNADKTADGGIIFPGN